MLCATWCGEGLDSMNLKGLSLVILSFFKTYKIDYLIESNIARFSCIMCGDEAEINLQSSQWNCSSCLEQGTLKSLNEHMKQNPQPFAKTKVFNYKKTKHQLFEQLDALSVNNSGLKEELDGIRHKLTQLLDYQEKKTTPDQNSTHSDTIKNTS